jgi:hypothetical protein
MDQTLTPDRPRALGDFEGHWQIDRLITQADGTTGQFTGTARFVPAPGGGLDYHEEGTLALGSHPPVRAERRYLWTSGLEVFFHDGRPFHQVPAEGGTAEHFCPPDTYRVAYDFSDWPFWRTTWRVTGPRKDYVMLTEFSPRA